MVKDGKAQQLMEGLPRRLLSSSFSGVPYRVLNMNHKKELLRSLWVGFRRMGPIYHHILTRSMDCLEGSTQAPSKVYTYALFAAGEVYNQVRKLTIVLA